MDNWITIGTKLDNKQLEKDLKNEKSRLERFEKEAEKLTTTKIKAEANLENYYKEIELAKQTTDEILSKVQTQEEVDNQLKQENVRIEEINNKYSKELSALNDINKKIEENAHNQGLVKNEIEETTIKLKQAQGFSGVKDSIDNVGKSVTNVTKRIGKMAIAVFGIRSAFMFVRNAINTIAGDDEQLKADIDYMKSAIAYTLEPLVRSIVNLAKQLMFYVGYIVKAWTGKNIFENANKSLKNANKSAKALNKELNKTLAGFDEMNILQDTSSSSSESGGEVTPSFDLSALENFPVPSWLQFIVDHKDEILAILGGIASGLLAIKLGIKGIKALGIGLAIAGIIYAIEKVIDFMNDPTFDNFIGILEGIALAVTGVAIAFSAWPVAIGAVIALVVLLIVQNFDKIRELFIKAIDWLDKNVLGGLRRLFGPLGDILYAPIKFFMEMAFGAFNSLFGGIKQVIDGIVKIFNGDFKGGISDVFNGLLSILMTPFNALQSGINGLWNHVKDSVNYWKDAFKENFDAIKDFFMKPINDFIDGIKGLWGKIKKSVEDTAKKIGDKLNPANIVNNVSKGLGSVGNNIKKLFGFSKGGIVVPKLASGGIINQPGRGVPLASAVGGERGAEGVIPLTDSQQMMLLGEAIGKFITVNANIINTMNGRIISRELQRVQNDSDFAYNR